MPGRRCALHRAIPALILAACLTGLLLASLPRPAAAAWPADSTVNLPVCTAAGNQQVPASCSDGAGGIIITWQDKRGADDDIYAQHVLASGTVDPAWPVDGRAICTATGVQRNPVIVSDNAGGAIISWLDYRAGLVSHVYAQRIRSTGVVDPAWPVDGRLASTSTGDQGFPRIATDNAGGALITFDDDVSGGLDIYVQRILATGVTGSAWPATGVHIPSGDFGNNTPWIVADGSGGGIVVWGPYSNSSALDIRAHHILGSADLDLSWPAYGCSLVTKINEQGISDVMTDGAGGAFVAFYDRQNGFGSEDLYMHHVKSNGTRDPVWPTQGSAICAIDSSQYISAMCSDGGSGAIICWQDGRTDPKLDLYAQHVFSNGFRDSTWGINGRLICNATDTQQQMSLGPDGSGGAIITWQDNRSVDDGIYAQHVRSGGSIDPAWTTNGRAVCVGTGTRFGPKLVMDGLGGALICWYDRRNGSNYDIYAQRIGINGVLGGGPKRYDIPPVVISTLKHDHTLPNPPIFPNTVLADYVVFPGGVGYTSSGFTTTLVNGDTIRVRFEAPAGKKFKVHKLTGSLTEIFNVDAYWLAASDAISHADSDVVVFENFAGVAPGKSYSFVGVGNAGHVVKVTKQYNVIGDFEFTAMDLRLVCPHAFTVGSQSFAAVNSNSSRSWGTIAQKSDTANHVVMEIVDVTPADVPGATGHGGTTLSLRSPTPTRGPVDIAYSLERAGEVRLSVHDVLGRQIAVLESASRPAGAYRASWNAASCARAGIYFLRYETAGHVLTKKLVIAR